MEATTLTVTEILDGLQKSLAGRNCERDDQKPTDAMYWAEILKDRALWILEVSRWTGTA